MIEITSREQAIEELGKLGAYRWDEGLKAFLGYEFIYPEPSEPLTDDELYDLWRYTEGPARVCLREIVNANDARNAEIEKANSEPLKWRTDSAPDEWVAMLAPGRVPGIAHGSDLTCGAKWHPLPPR